MAPVLSLILPVYNLQDYLESCLLSILPQLTPQVEVLLVDDGSTDKSLVLCRRYESAYPGIRVYPQENQGVSVARNVGLRRARGEYVFFIDDDLLPPGTLAMILQQIQEHPNVEIFCGGCVKFQSQGPLPSLEPFPEGEVRWINETHGQQTLLRLLQSGRFLPAAWAAIVRRSLLTEHHIQFPPGWINNEDVDTALNYYLQARHVRALPRPHYYYRQGRQGAATGTFTLERVQNSHRMISSWQRRLQGSQMPRELLSYVRDYLAYQYAIALGSAYLCQREEREEALAMLRPLRGLLKSNRTPKTALVARLYRVVGYRATAKALSIYILRKRQGGEEKV